MKKLVLSCISIIGLGVASLSAQKITTDKVPGPVAQTFRSKFPESQQQTWGKVDSNYRVVFFNGKKRQAATFAAGGSWLNTETEISPNQLPGKVYNTISKEFEGFNMQEAYLIETSDKGTLYEVTILKGRENYDLQLSAKGEILKKIAGETE